MDKRTGSGFNSRTLHQEAMCTRAGNLAFLSLSILIYIMEPLFLIS